MRLNQPLTQSESGAHADAGRRQVAHPVDGGVSGIDAVGGDDKVGGGDDVGGGKAQLPPHLGAVDHQAVGSIRPPQQKFGAVHIAVGQGVADAAAADGAALQLQRRHRFHPEPLRRPPPAQIVQVAAAVAPQGEIGAGNDAPHFQPVHQQVGELVGVHIGQLVGELQADDPPHAGLVQQLHLFLGGDNLVDHPVGVDHLGGMVGKGDDRRDDRRRGQRKEAAQQVQMPPMHAVKDADGNGGCGARRRGGGQRLTKTHRLYIVHSRNRIGSARPPTRGRFNLTDSGPRQPTPARRQRW